MPSRPLKHRSFVNRSLGLEQLQQRSMLAGNVSAFLDRGTLIVNGDIGDNELRITQVGKDMVQLATMSSPTTINNQLSVATFRVTKGMIFNMGGGNDVLQFDGVTMRAKKDLVVNMGVGDDNLQFNNVNVLRIRAMLGQGHDSATVTNSKVERSLNIFGETGDEQITLSNSKFGEKSVVDGNAGANFINQSNVKFGRKLQNLNLTFGTRPAITPTTTLKANDDSITIDEDDTAVTLNPLTNDVPNTNININRPVLITVEPTHGAAVENPDGTITYTHDGSGINDEFTYRITDSTGATSTAKFTITVTPINDAPVAVTDSGSVTEDSGSNATGNVLTNDTDEDGPSKTVSVVNGQASNVGTDVAGQFGTFHINADGTYTYDLDDANATVNALNNGGSLTDSMTYTVTDGTLTSTANLTITINGHSDALTAVNDVGSATENSAANATGNVLTNDSDPNNAALSVSAVGGQAGNVGIDVAGQFGTFHINANGSYTYDLDDTNATVNALIAGGTLTDTMAYTLSNGTTTTTANLVITITGVNDGPAGVADASSATEDSGINTTGNVLTNDTDPDGPTKTVSAVNGQTTNVGTNVVGQFGTFRINADGSYTYDLDDTNTTVNALNTGATLTDTMAYTVSDGTLTSTVNLTITIDGHTDGTNSAPVGVPDTASVTEDSGTNGTGNVLTNDTDPDGPSKTVSAVNGQAGNVGVDVAGAFGTFHINADGTFTYDLDDANSTVNALIAGGTLTDTMAYTVSDGTLTSTTNLTVTITGVNDAPVGIADPASATEDSGTNTTGNVLTNDTDPDGPTKTVSAVNGQASNVATDVAGQFGTFHINADGSFTYDLDDTNAAVNALNDGETLTDTMAYTVSDGTLTSTVNLTVTINGDTDGAGNTAPFADDDLANVDEGGMININVAANDTDDNNDLDLDSIIVVQPAHGSVVVNGDGTVTYTHDGTETTEDSFTYTIKDGDGVISNSATVSLTIVPLNDAPDAGDDGGSVSEGGTTTVDLSANDFDDDGTVNDASIALVDQPDHGTIDINADGTVTYHHDGGESTIDTFTYTINDNNGTVSNIATVTITITPVNDAPTALADVAEVDEGASVLIPVTANDDDPENQLDPDSIEITDPPQHGSFTVNSDGTVTYLHDGSESISDSFSYTIKDIQGLVSAEVTVTITIAPVNDAPLAANESGSVTEDSGTPATGNVLTNDSDPENTPLSVSAVDGVLGNVGTDVAGQFGTFHINADGSYTYTLDDSNTTVNELDDLEEIIDSIAYTVSDGELTAIATLSVTIHGNTD